MFFYNRASQWAIEDTNIKNVILSASSLTRDEVERRFKRNYFKNVEIDNILFDPQLYFSTIHMDNCRSCFSKLSTYNLFNPDPPQHDSQKFAINDFKKSILKSQEYQNIIIPDNTVEIFNRIVKSLEFQNQLGVSRLILPTPLISPGQDNYDVQLKWINQGLEAAKSFDKPYLITVAINEAALMYGDMDENNLVSVILDSLTAMDNVDGFYIVIEQNTLDGKIRNPDILKFVFETSYLLGHILGKEVIFNYIDDLGFLALSLGASGFGGGYFSKEKQLSPELYADESGWGARYAKLYSHSLIIDLYAEKDLKKIYNLNLFNILETDITSLSQDLYDSYINKHNLPANWATTQNNDSISQKNKVNLLDKKTNEILLLNFDERIKYAREWLMNADINTVYLNHRLADDPISPSFSHIHVWQNEFEKFLVEKNII